MESSYSIHPADNLVTLSVRGELTVDGLIQAMTRVGADPQYRAGMHAVADFRQSFGNWDYSEIQRYRDFVVRAAGTCECRWAALVKPGTLVAVAHVVIVISEALGARAHMQLFEDADSARRWACGELE